MSHNQSRVEKSEAQLRKPGRSGSSGPHRSYSGGGGGKGGGGSTAPPPSSLSNSSSSLSANQSFKKPINGQGGQPRVSPASANSESNVAATARAVQNGTHVPVQPPLHGASNAPISGAVPKSVDSPISRSTRAVPRAPSSSSQSNTGASDSMATATPAKADVSRAFSLQFGTITPGFMNGMQIPARTSSAPPNLDEQKRDQARHNSFKAIPTLPVPSTPKQQQLRKDVGSVNQSNIGESHPQSQVKREVRTQVPAAPATTAAQKSSVPPITGISIQMPFQQPQVPVQFGGPNPQIQSQGVTATSMQMPMPLPVGSASQVQQPVFVPNLHSHQLQPQGMMHQSQNLNFTPQMGHHPLGNMGMGITPQFAQQQPGNFGAPRKTVKITHPKTHEELRLDKRTDPYLDSGSSVQRSHPNVTSQSQPIPSFTSAHQINYYPSIQASSYNPTSIFFQTQTSHPLTSTQMAPGSSTSRYNYPVAQAPQTVFMSHSALKPLSIAVTGPPMHDIAEPLHTEQAQDAYAAAGPAPSSSVQVTVKPSVGSRGEKFGSSSVAITPIVSKGESPKLLKPSDEGSSFLPRTDSEIGSENSIQQSKFVSEPSGSISLSATAKPSGSAAQPVAASVHRPPPSTLSGTLSASPDEFASVMVNTEGRRREAVRRSDSLKDHQKKLSKKDSRHSPSQYQGDISDFAVSSKSSSLKTSREAAKHPENMQAPPSGVAGSTSSLPSQGLEHKSSLRDGISETEEVKETLTLSETPGVVLKSTSQQLPDICIGGPDASEAMTDSVRCGERSICEPSNTSDLETISDNLDAAHHGKQGNCTLLEVQLKIEIMGTADQVKAELPEGPEQENSHFEIPTGSITSESLEGGKQSEQDFIVKETTSVYTSFSGETEQESNHEAVSCSSEVDRTIDGFIKSAVTSSDSIDVETAPSIVSSNVSSEDKISTMDASIKSESMDSEEVAIMSHHESAPGQTSFSSDVTWELEEKGVENTYVGPVSTSLFGSKDRPTFELNKAKTTTASAKKKWKEILQKADAAGTTADLYMAYKGPEEKQETTISSESVDSTSSVHVKLAHADDAEKVVLASEDDVQNKAEPDDWEDAADISTPKLETSDNENQVHGGLMHHDEDGNGVSGTKKYTRDFLLTFSEQYIDLPAGFEIGSDIAEALMTVPIGVSHLVDRELYPNSVKIIDRPSGGSWSDRRGSGMVDDDKWSKGPGPFPFWRDPRLEVGQGGNVVGFRPGQGGIQGVVRNSRGQSSGQYVDGILSGPMQSLTSQAGMQRNSHDTDRWQRATGIQRGLIPSPLTPLQVMHKAEKKYEVGKVSDKEAAKQRQLKAILNKLTPQNFEKLFEQVKDVNIDNAVTLTGVISQIFDKALTEPTFCEMYANFCYHLAVVLPDFSENNEKITFKRLLLNKCQEEFERGEREEAEANKVEEEGEIKRPAEEREEKKTQARRRMLGNIRLIGELYKKKMLTERIMHECIQKLLGQYQNPDEENIEALCKLTSTIGEIIDHSKAKEHMDYYFDTMLTLSNNMKLSSRLRFMLRDAIDLRKNKWQQRRKVEGPKKIDEVHRDAAQERQAQTNRLARGSGNSSSARRGQPMDFASRGSTVLSSPNALMSGLRGSPSQVRGYVNQDVRLEDRHPYESRTLSVTLPQKPIADDSITLGPQGGLARGMSIRGQPLMSSVPLAEISPNPVDSRRMAAGPNGYSSVSEWTHYNSREEFVPRYAPERFTGPYDQSNIQERNTYFGNRDLRNTDRSLDRSMTNLPATPTHMQGSGFAQNLPSEKMWPEERLRDMSLAAIKEFYSAKDEKEVALCIKDLNSPSFYPSMISIWVTDSFERKDIERDLLAKLLVNLTRSADSLLSQVQLLKGFESVLATLEDAVNDAPKAGEFFGRLLAKVIIDNVIPLRDIGRLIHEGGEEPGRLLQIGLASEVLSSILEVIRLEKGESVLNEIHKNSNLRLEDFRSPDPIKSRKLDAFRH